MDFIREPVSVAARIVQIVLDDLYGRAEGDWWFDRMPPDVRTDLVTDLVAVVQQELDRG